MEAISHNALTDKKYYCNSTIDLLKLFGSFMIFTMHINAFGDYQPLGYIWEYVTRWAVPFFFITSSFFLFSKGNDGNICLQDLQKYCKRIGLLYLLWFIYNLPSVFYSRLYSQGLNSIKTWLFFLKSALFSSTFTGSWYLLSCVFSAVLIYYLSKRIKTLTCIVLFIPVQFLCFFSSVYYGIIPTQFGEFLHWCSFPLNIFGGVFYFALGKLLCEKQHFFWRISREVCFLLSGAFIVLFVLEIVVSRKVGYYYSSDQGVVLPFLSFFLVLGCLKTNLELRNTVLLRKISTIVYCGQGNVLLGAAFVCRFIGVQSSILKYLFGLIMISGVVVVVLFLQKKTSIRVFKYLT